MLVTEAAAEQIIRTLHAERMRIHPSRRGEQLPPDTYGDEVVGRCMSALRVGDAPSLHAAVSANETLRIEHGHVGRCVECDAAALLEALDLEVLAPA